MAKAVELDDEDIAVTKQQVRDWVPKRIKELQFGISYGSPDESLTPVLTLYER